MTPAQSWLVLLAIIAALLLIGVPAIMLDIRIQRGQRKSAHIINLGMVDDDK